MYQTKYYHDNIKKSKFSFGWHLQIDEKSIIVKKDQGEKLIQTLIFLSCQNAQEVLRRRNVVHIIEFFLHQRSQHKPDPS